MAGKLVLRLALVLCLLLLLHVFAEARAEQQDGSARVSSAGGATGNLVAGSKVTGAQPNKINCDFACSLRCKEASRRAFCMRACGTCCARCQCVPAGTYGNHSMCPCYASLTTHGRRPKCP